MDKDLKSAILYENCGCYDRALDAAIKVLEKSPPESDNAIWARKIVKSLGEEFLKQRFMDKAMECFKILTDYPVPEEVLAKVEAECAPEDSKAAPFAGLGPDTVAVSTEVSQDVHEILTALQTVEENKGKNEADLIREGVYLLLLKYATDKKIRELMFNKMQKVIGE